MTEQEAKQNAAASVMRLIRGINTRPTDTDHQRKAEEFLSDFYAFLLARASSFGDADKEVKSP